MDKKITITMQINQEDLDKGFRELVMSLSDDDKKEMLKNLLHEYITGSIDVKYFDYKKKLIGEVAERYRSDIRYGINDYINTSDYKEKLEEFSKTRDGMFNIIKDEITTYVTNIINKIVEEDTEVKSLVDEISKTIKDNQKNIILDSIINIISDNLILDKKVLFDTIRNRNW